MEDNRIWIFLSLIVSAGFFIIGIRDKNTKRIYQGGIALGIAFFLHLMDREKYN